jgi:nitroimidazol reductase NimA-like FMN-containing flavoprotein (pyridoxamine 5'-phosphate oxidase superfamily)
MPAPDLTMPPEVRAAFLAEERVLRLATVDGEGWPVVVPLWFVHHAEPGADTRGELWIWNLDRARRTARLEEGGRCGVTVDAGRDYHELRGVTARATPRRVDDDVVPLAVRTAYARKYFGSDEPLAPADHHTWFALALSAERSWDFRRIGV